MKSPKLPLPPGQFKAYLFDCDGTIADSMPLHYVAWNQVMGEWNVPFPEDLFYAWGGMPILEIVERLAREHGVEMPLEEVAERKEALYYESLPQLRVIPEVLEHIEAGHGKVRFAVVSGGTRTSVEKSLEAIGLRHKFETLVCAGEYQNSKPHPEPYLMAAELLNVLPEECLVFEDTDMGIESAKAAGMAWVKVPAPWERACAQ